MSQYSAQTDLEPWSLEHLTNVGHVITATASRMPDAIAVAAPVKNSGSHRPIDYHTITFQQLEADSNRIANGITGIGIEPGTRMALMVPPGIEFVKFVFGLFKAGIVVILIDPGMGRKNMVRCLAEAQPEGLVGIRLAQLMRTLFARQFRDCQRNIVVGSRWWPGCTSANSLIQRSSDDFVPLKQTRQTKAAIIFTTGSTGPPKGVLYRHQHFLEQARQIRDYFSIRPGTVDVSGFPLFALFNSAMGATTVFPRMDATRPAEIDPLDFRDAVENFRADQSFGSPALWDTVTRQAGRDGWSLPSIRRVLTAGAPVSAELLGRIRDRIDPDGEAYTPYGATESLPVACNSASIVLSETASRTRSGHGICVGHRFADIAWKVIEIDDGPIPTIDQAVEVDSGVIGELIVQGNVVTDRYVTQTDANAAHKIDDGDLFWHRMGDVGYLDGHDRFWFCGRKSHRVQTAEQVLFTVPSESIINSHPAVRRSALVGIGEPGSQFPVFVVEPESNQWPQAATARSALIGELLAICGEHEQLQKIDQILFRKKLPVDIRHNSKIFREKLAVWAQKQLPR